MPRRPPARSAQVPSSRAAELEALLAERDARVAELEHALAHRDRAQAERDRQLAEVHAQQAATTEVLAAIRRSPTDLQAVLDTIVRSATRLFGGRAVVFRVEGDAYRPVANTTGTATLNAPGEWNPLSRDRTVVGRAMIDGEVVQVDDLAAVPVEELPAPDPRRGGVRTLLAAPLPRQGV